MGERSGVFKFFVILLLVVMVLLQLLAMKQSDRLFERINRFEEVLRSGATVNQSRGGQTSSIQQQQKPGDNGDWLVWVIGAEPGTLNPVTGKDLYSSYVTGGSIFESLLEYDPEKVKLRPLLAESYEISPDGLEMTFKLRPEACFSDGKPVTADDVLFSYQTVMDPNVDASNLASYYARIKSVTKIDNLTVKFVLGEPYFKGFEMAGLMSILPKHIYQYKHGDEFNKRRSDPVGSGPYAFQKWEVGRQIVLTRNERYWKAGPKLDKIVFKVITNDMAALQALRTHDVDYMMPTSEQFVDMEADPEFTKKFSCLKYWSPDTGYAFIGWNQKTQFFADKRVRLAMTYLINRQLLVDTLLKGMGQIVSGPFYIKSPQYDQSILPWPYDPDKARQLLSEAGWKDTDGDGILDKNGVAFRFKLTFPTGRQMTERMVKQIKDEMARVGIDVTPDPYEWSVFDEKLNARNFEAVTLAWGLVVLDDPYQIWHSSQIQGRGSNFVGFNDPEVDRLIEVARKTMDDGKRNELYHRVHQIIHETQPYTFLWTRPSTRFLDKRFENVKVYPLGLDLTEWYVPKKDQRYK